jgi:steroid 5-alpha reductase family enzyme
MKFKHVINLHKGFTFLVIFALMLAYQNFNVGAWVYLALHGTYGFMWLTKDSLFPDKQWEKETSLGMALISFILLGAYWIAPFLLISRAIEPSPPLIAAAVAMNLYGVFLHFSSDAQKYYTLKYRPGLITEGFFARCRNTNYLGEVLIYLSFALLAQHWLPYFILGCFVSVAFVPNMLKKDKSLSRYPEFEQYKKDTGLILPKLIKTQENAISSESQQA